MASYEVTVQAFLNQNYVVRVEADNYQEAEILARDEAFGHIDPNHIEITVVDWEAE